MTLDKDAPMFANIKQGRPGYFYTAEGEDECIRLIERDGSGNLWTDRGYGGEKLGLSVDDVLGAVPTLTEYERLQALAAQQPWPRVEDNRLSELEALVEYLRAQVRACKAALAVLCQEEP